MLANLGNLPVLKADLSRLMALGHLGNPALINLFTLELETSSARAATKPARQATAAAGPVESPVASAGLTPIRP